MSSPALNSLNDLLDVLRLPVEFTEGIREGHVRLGQMIEWLVPVLVLEKHEAECELALCRLDVLRAKLDLVEVKDYTQMLLGLLVVITVNWAVSVVFNWVAEVLLDNELAPDLYYLLVEVLGLLNLTLLLEDLSHVEIAAAQVDTLRAVELALEINGVG